jgi:hypothetical protein
VDAAALQDAARKMKDLVKDLAGGVGAGSLAMGAA